MKIREKSKLQDYRTALVVLGASLAILILVAVLCTQYYQRLTDTVKAESGEYIQEISKQIASNVGKTVGDNFSVLGTIATVLKSSHVTEYDQLQPIIQAQQSYWNYQNILLVDSSGVAYDAYGSTVTLASDQYLQDVIVDRRRAMSSAQEVSGKECVIFAIPINNIAINGTQMVALLGTYDLSTFDQIMSLSAFSGQGYVHIIRRDGTVIIRSSSPSAPETGYNILSSLSSAKFDKDNGLDALKTAIANSQYTQTEFTLNGQRQYLACTPMSEQDWTLLTFVPTAVANQKSSIFVRLTLLICAFITLLFGALITFLLLSFYRHKHKLEQIAYVDPVTGGNTIQRFYELAGEYLETPGKPIYALIYINIEKFKILNEQFGRKACDDLLTALNYGILDSLTPKECIGHLFADNFCVLAEYNGENTLVARFDSWYEAASQYQAARGGMWLSPIMEFGVYVISNESIPYPSMIDRAKLALRDAGSELHGRLRYAIYDEEIRRKLFREKQLEDLMESALAQSEFQVYLQPKYRADTEQVGGAEALVRWVSKTEGMIFPDEFISLFEKNGFVVRLDLWVFEQVCKSIRVWLDAGLTPVKVSVNCSRVHLRNPDFLVPYREICNRCNTPPQFLEIELTENVVFEDVGKLTKTIDEIHAMGFGCSMDDFGSGYSSLNLIQDIPVDTIKLDKIFFRNSAREIERTESVVDSILHMARRLHMATVAEGVEERIHVDMLKRLGCDYIQGYYFARPMPIVEFEKLLFGFSLPTSDEV